MYKETNSVQDGIMCHIRMPLLRAGSLCQPAQIVLRGSDECSREEEQVTSFLTSSPEERGSTAPKAVVLTRVINGALTRWQVFEHITALTLPLHY